LADNQPFAETIQLIVNRRHHLASRNGILRRHDRERFSSPDANT